MHMLFAHGFSRRKHTVGFGHDGFDETVDFIGFVQRQNMTTVWDDFVGFCAVAHQDTVVRPVNLVQRERVTFGRVKREIVPP